MIGVSEYTAIVILSESQVDARSGLDYSDDVFRRAEKKES